MSPATGHDPDSAEIPPSGGRGSRGFWTIVGVVVTLASLGVAVFMAVVAHRAEERERKADERARVAEQQAAADREQTEKQRQTAQAQLVNYRFLPDANGVSESLVIENRSQFPITKVHMYFEDLTYFLLFDLIEPCSWVQVGPLAVVAVDGKTYDLRSSSAVSLRFLDEQKAGWKKDFTSGSTLEELDSMAVPPNMVNASPTFKLAAKGASHGCG